jgi:hypothetical protein
LSDPVPDEQLTPRAGCWLFLLPILLGVAMIAAYIVVFVYGIIGHPADGPRVTMTYVGCSEAQDLVRKRVDAMGLGDPVLAPTPDGFTVTATLPSDAAIANGIPATLARTGSFAALDAEQGTVIVDGPIASSVMQYGTDAPETVVQLDAEESTTLRKYMEEHPHGRMSYRVDGEEAFTRGNTPAEAKGTIELPVYGVTVEQAMKIAAERDIVLANGPLPCAITLRP